MNTVFISHSIYLTPQERKSLMGAHCFIETVGVNVPFNSDKEYVPITEMFCKYTVTNEPAEGKPVEIRPDGYVIHLDLNRCSKLQDVPDGNSGSLILIIEDTMKKDEETIPVVHQIAIKDLTELERTAVCEQLAEALKH